MKRRSFLKTTSIASLPVCIHGLSIQSFLSPGLLYAFNGESDRILVLIQLNGGNDGLNMLIPLDQYAGLTSARSSILIPQNKTIKINNEVGLHPAMTDLNEAWKNGMVQFIQATGYPNQNRSHFRSQDIWISSSGANEFVDTGWMGRYFDDAFPGFPDGFPNIDCPDPIAISVGTNVNETCQGTRGNYSLAVVDPINITALDDPALEPVPANCYGEELSFLRDAIKQTNAYSGRIKEAASLGQNVGAKYLPNNTLAQKLKTVTKLISGGLKTKVYVVNHVGFDTHSSQVNANDTSTGTHANLLGQLSNAICAFQDDLVKQGLEKRVVGMTFSEFGRRIKSYGSGTDHGSAAPMILFGSCINPIVLGNNPIISTSTSDQEGVAMQYDFRSVYGSLLNQWFEVDKAKVQSLVYDQYQDLPIILGCKTTAVYETEKKDVFTIELYANIVNEYAKLTITSTKSTKFSISLFNDEGFQLRNWNATLDGSGSLQHTISLDEFPAGIYFVRVADRKFQKTERVVKVR